MSQQIKQKRLGELKAQTASNLSKIQQIENNISNMNAEKEALKHENISMQAEIIDIERVSKIEVRKSPKKDTKFFYINIDGTVSLSLWTSSPTDWMLFKSYNFFLEKEKAEIAAKRFKYRLFLDYVSESFRNTMEGNDEMVYPYGYFEEFDPEMKIEASDRTITEFPIGYFDFDAFMNYVDETEALSVRDALIELFKHKL